MVPNKEKQNYPLKNFYKDIYHRYDLVNQIFTFGQDRKWRERAVGECLDNSPKRILDVCTGTGDLIIEIAQKVDNSVILTGYDFSSEMLQRAEQKAGKVSNSIAFVEGDVAKMPFETGYYDSVGITFGLRNLVYENSNASHHLFEIHRVIRKGGRFVILESSKPGNLIWRFFNGIYLQFILPYLGGIISGNLKAYKYLARSSKNYYTREEMQKILESGGFKVLRSSSLFLGSVMLVVAEKQD